MPRVRATETFRGKPLRLTFAISNPPTGGVTDWTLVFTFARNRNCSSKIWTTTPEVTDTLGAEFEVLIPADVTDQDPGKYWWDVWRTDEGEEDILAIGFTVIKSDVRLPAG